MAKTSLRKNLIGLKGMVTKLKVWALSNKLEFGLIVLVMVVAAFVRFYRIDEYMTFLGDEGRDAIAMSKILAGHPVLLGPGTSIGNMYLGPLYYYLGAPFLLVYNYSPAGPSSMVALLAVATTLFVWFVSREWFGKFPALVATLLYALSPVVITYSKSSWNPNIMPFFTLLAIWSVWKVYQGATTRWLLVAGVACAFILQSHYLGLLVFPTLGVWYIAALIKTSLIHNSDDRSSLGTIKHVFVAKYLKHTLLAVGVFVVLMSPVVIFDARHGWRNLEALKAFFSDRGSTVSARPWNSIPKILPLWERVTISLVSIKNGDLNYFVVWGGLGVVGLFFAGQFRRLAKVKIVAPTLLLLSWILIGLVGLGLYKQEIYDHYFGFLYPAVFMLIALITYTAWGLKNTLIRVVLVGCLVWAVFLAINNSPLQHAPNNQLGRTIGVVEEIAKQSGGNRFNFGLIAERNYEDAYLYFMNRKAIPVIAIDPQNSKETITDILFVVCEMEEKKCDPTHNPKAQIANFGWSQIASITQVNGVILYKLVHSKGN